MPKQVDHEQRRTGIVDALIRIAARDGLGAVSIRSVAAEAGIPAPQVQYYFGTKAQLLSGALERLGGLLVGRGLELMNEAGPDAPPEAMLRAALEGSRPVDDESRDALVLFFAFYVAALTDPVMAETRLLESQRFITQHFAALIRAAQDRGEAPEDIDPDREALLILFANTGLILGALTGLHPVADATSVLDYHLARVFRTPDAGRARRG